MSLANLFDLSGHVAVVTGGNGGIGRSIALGLARAGAAIVVLARNEEKNQRVLGELKALGRPALAVRVDVYCTGAIAAGLWRYRHERNKSPSNRPCCTTARASEAKRLPS